MNTADTSQSPKYLKVHPELYKLLEAEYEKQKQFNRILTPFGLAELFPSLVSKYSHNTKLV